MKGWKGPALLVVVLSSLLVACGTSLTPPPDTGDVGPSTTLQPSPRTSGGGGPTTTSAQPDAPIEGDAPIVDWTDPEGTVSFDGGWSLAACEGDAPLLCVEKDGGSVGAVEAAAYPVESLDWFDPSAGSDKNLAVLAEEFTRAIKSDRTTGCGDDYVFEPFPSKPFALANTPGIFFGFTGTMPDGNPSELNLQYATLVEDRIVAILAAGYDQGGCPGRDDLSGFTTSELAEFRPHLESVLHESLPRLEG